MWCPMCGCVPVTHGIFERCRVAEGGKMFWKFLEPGFWSGATGSHWSLWSGPGPPDPPWGAAPSGALRWSHGSPYMQTLTVQMLIASKQKKPRDALQISFSPEDTSYYTYTDKPFSYIWTTKNSCITGFPQTFFTHRASKYGLPLIWLT